MSDGSWGPQLAGRMRGAVIAPSHADYEVGRRVWNGMIDRRPALIARCAHYDVVEALRSSRVRIRRRPSRTHPH